MVVYIYEKHQVLWNGTCRQLNTFVMRQHCFRNTSVDGNRLCVVSQTIYFWIWRVILDSKTVQIMESNQFNNWWDMLRKQSSTLRKFRCWIHVNICKKCQDLFCFSSSCSYRRTTTSLNRQQEQGALIVIELKIAWLSPPFVARFDIHLTKTDRLMY